MEVVVTANNRTEVANRMDKRLSITNNISQSVGSILQAMKNLPGPSLLIGKAEITTALER